jgi:hypothetical protein
VQKQKQILRDDNQNGNGNGKSNGKATAAAPTTVGLAFGVLLIPNPCFLSLNLSCLEEGFGFAEEDFRAAGFA